MKIAICINNFKNTHTHPESMCIESLYRVQKKYNVDLINIMFTDEHYDIPGFKSYSVLEKNSKNYFPKFNKKLPTVNEIFDKLALLEYDYFVFINNDIIVSDRFIKQIKDEPFYDSFVASKLHFSELKSLDDPNSIPDAISVHGFDGFGIKRTWWVNNSSKFNTFFLGKPYWDTYFFTMCYISGKCKVLNKPPVSIFHVAHESDAMLDDELTEFNTASFQKNPLIGRIWFTYVYNVLLKRETHNNIKWCIPFSNECELEKQYLKV